MDEKKANPLWNKEEQERVIGTDIQCTQYTSMRMSQTDPSRYVMNR